MPAMTASNLRVKIVSEDWELEQVYQLTYRTFVEEIPQHAPNEERRRVDPRLERSVCFICLDGPQLRGMVVFGGERPFSLDDKVADLDSYLPPHERPCEIRLLAVEQDDRGGLVFTALMTAVLRHGRRHGYDLGLLSGAESQLHLYRHMGCIPFGPPLGTEAARFQAMYLTWDRMSPALLRRVLEPS
ncbi:MAG: N-acyl amino acid synthase FeeM domain-containing protein [Thermoanaerobaculia bacterium]